MKSTPSVSVYLFATVYAHTHTRVHIVEYDIWPVLLPVFMYGAQVWTFTKDNMDNIAKAQSSGETNGRNETGEWEAQQKQQTAGIMWNWNYAGRNTRQRDNDRISQ